MTPYEAYEAKHNGTPVLAPDGVTYVIAQIAAGDIRLVDPDDDDDPGEWFRIEWLEVAK